MPRRHRFVIKCPYTVIVGPRLDLVGAPTYRYSNGEVRRVRSRYVWLLLGFLAVHPGRWCLRRTIAETLWPNRSPTDALHLLRQTLLYLRTGLPESDLWLGCEPDALRIDPHRLEIQAYATDPSAGQFLEGFQADWVERVRESQTSPTPASLSASPLGIGAFLPGSGENRRSAVLGLTPLWLAQGRYDAPLEEIHRLRAALGQRLDPELSICEAELMVASHRLQAAEVLLRAFQRDRCEPEIWARVCLAQAIHSARRYQWQECVAQALDALRLAKRLGMALAQKRALHVALVGSGRIGDGDLEARVQREIHRSLDRGSDESYAAILEFAVFTARATHPEEPGFLARAQLIVGALEDAQEPGYAGLPLARLGRRVEGAGFTDQARAMYTSSANMLSATDCRREIAEVWTYLGDLDRVQGRHDTSLRFHMLAVDVRRRLHDPVALATSLRGAGLTALASELPDEGLAYLAEADHLFAAVGDDAGRCSIAIAMSRCLARLGRVRAAKRVLREAIAYLEQLPEALLDDFPTGLSSPTDLRDELTSLDRLTTPQGREELDGASRHPASRQICRHFQ